MATVIWSDADEVRATLRAELDRLVDELRDVPGVEQVWVFGSLISGTPHMTSDLDLLVVQRTDETPVERGLSLHRRLRPRAPLDLFVYTPDEFATRGRFTDEVRRHGQRVL